MGACRSQTWLTTSYEPGADITALTVADGLPQRHVAAAARRLDEEPLVKAFLTALRDAAVDMAEQGPAPGGRGRRGRRTAE